MDTDSFIISCSKGNIPDGHMNISNLDIPFKNNIEVQKYGKFKYEFGSRILDECIV